jgi:hypothetical protein
LEGGDKEREREGKKKREKEKKTKGGRARQPVGKKQIRGSLTFWGRSFDSPQNNQALDSPESF